MVDLSGYIIILINDNGKIKLYGSSADNAEYPEVSDEILEVNGRTLENATDAEVSQHIHQCIRSGTISLQVTRRSGHKMKLDGPNADRIRDAWVIALERGARERLQKLPALKKIKPRDIQAILHQQINEEISASTSKIETPIIKDSNNTNSHITVTLADGQPVNRTPPKLSNGTVPKSISNDDNNDLLINKDDHYINKEVLEKQRNHSEELKLLHPSLTAKLGERRSSSPFQNGRTEVLIGEPEGGPRSPRGSTSSAINENFLSTDNPEPICRSRRRSGSGVTDIHLQQTQLQDNNNSPSLRESKDSRNPNVNPDEMWVPGVTPGHHRELPVDVPDTLLQQAYANNKVILPSTLPPPPPPPLPITDSSVSVYPPTNYNINNINNNNNNNNNQRLNSASVNKVDLSPLCELRELTLNIKNDSSHQHNHKNNHHHNNPRSNNHNLSNLNLDSSDQVDDLSNLTQRIIEITIDKNSDNDSSNDSTTKSPILSIFDEIDSPTSNHLHHLKIKESNVDIDDDYPFAKEDYPTMLKTCSDDSASPRSSSGRSDSTTALDTSLIIPGKESPLYDARRIDLGSPCRTIPDLSIYGMTRDTTSFDNPAYGLDLHHDLHQGLLIRSDEVLDLRIIGDNGKNCEIIPIGKPEKSLGKKKKPKNTSSFDVDLIGAKSTDDLLAADLTGFVTRTSIKKPIKKNNLPLLPTPAPLPPQVPTINGYSTLRNDNNHKSSLRSYREVAVDCPPDFIPVTKSHPIYPPPNKIDGRKDIKNGDNSNNNSNNVNIVNNNKLLMNDRTKSNESIGGLDDNDDGHKVRLKRLMHPGTLLTPPRPLYLLSNTLPNKLFNKNRKKNLPISYKLSSIDDNHNQSINYSLMIDDDDSCVGLSFSRLYSFRNENSDNKKNNIKSFVDNDDIIDDNNDSKVNIYLDNAENTALFNAYESLSLPSYASTASSSYSSLSLTSNNDNNINNNHSLNVNTNDACLMLKSPHGYCNTVDNDFDSNNIISVNDDTQRDVEAVDSHQDHKGNGVKPLLPPRDQKRAPARPPKDNLRLSTRNNNINDINNDNTSSNTGIESSIVSQPTPQQLHSIKKYQEQLRLRKDHEEKREFLNQSLRGSQKLHALESHAKQLAGQENPAYTQDEITTTTSNLRKEKEQTSGRASPKVAEELPEDPKILSYGEVVATLERLQLQLRNLSGALGPGVEAELEAFRSLVHQRRFATALATHNFVKTKLRTGKLQKPYIDDASNLARDCIELFEECQTTQTVKSPETIAIIEELTGLLTSYEMEGLLFAHDTIISYCDGIQLKDGPLSSSASEQSLSRHSSLRDSLRNTDNIKIIKIEKTNEPLGATVRNEGDAVIIGRVVRGGAADKSGLFNEGDEVLEVNGVEMRGKSVNEVCDILASMQGSLTFIVLPASSTISRNNVDTSHEDNNLIHHVRAHFDYDPEEDPYIPCRELGISFQKGDVLHVISQDDSNWWQAYREGEEDQTLAGLIPSKAFQHQRESMKQTITGGKTTLRGSKKSSTLLCTRKNPKKKKKRAKFGGSINDDGYPSYSTTTIDDYDSEEVLTYEEVALYYPRASHKRPIVLIGPPNIGRHELRQRLMQDSERFAAAIPHTSRPRKGSEVDGQDYHFITRQQFETDIVGRKFVEHGEYEKAYYGTSIEAIRSVVNSGKICVLNLHPQSLKILRNSDLKPYVVFVAPPSLEKLRQKRIKNNENYKEDELKDIIEKARDMEDKYGHLFDMIIINNDTDRAYNQLLTEINSLEREPQWVPATWVQ
ncbi:uncharacterized protein LOC130674055 isoform X2 [Microplitis mediator]|uniref:uncharacterized protein LOC130674055 isoform X2 n=1 Tax=Microplitis mediator TaxID=375433 RepID=UPI002556EE02|nr:uncharacterized protein LOC130674055 isoform X2 [Microplitis mediator]